MRFQNRFPCSQRGLWPRACRHCSGAALGNAALAWRSLVLWLTGYGSARPHFRQLNPTLKLAYDDIADDRHASRTVVEARDRREVFASRMAEDFRVLHGDLFQGLKA